MRSAAGYSNWSGRRGVPKLARWSTRRKRIDGAALVVARVPAANVEAMREMGDLLREKSVALSCLGAVFDDRPNFLVMVTKD